MYNKKLKHQEDEMNTGVRTEFKTQEELITAIDEGKRVFWKNSNYIVIKDSVNQYLIHSQCNNNYIGLTSMSGELNEKLSDFYMEA